jgi:hypothetical protein
VTASCSLNPCQVQSRAYHDHSRDLPGMTTTVLDGSALRLSTRIPCASRVDTDHGFGFSRAFDDRVPTRGNRSRGEGDRRSERHRAAKTLPECFGRSDRRAQRAGGQSGDRPAWLDRMSGKRPIGQEWSLPRSTKAASHGWKRVVDGVLHGATRPACNPPRARAAA